jgi:hypothetical protein
VTAARAVECWGGMLESTSPPSSNVPVTVKRLGSGQASVSVGEDTACAVSTVGGVKCWGDDNNGMLGNGNVDPSPVPVQVTGMTRGAKQVAVGIMGVCALSRTGQVRCWGAVPIGDGVSEVPVTLPWYR